MRILAISGSLRRSSINTAVVQKATRLAPATLSFSVYQALASLPWFNPDLEEASSLPAAVAELRCLVGESDGILICSPEYAGSIPGAMKNALDWLVGSSEFPGKPTAVINVSTRATEADTHLRFVLRKMSAHLIEEASITLPVHGGTNEDPAFLNNDAVAALLRRALHQLYKAIADRGIAH